MSATEILALANEGTTFTITASPGANGSMNPTGAVVMNYGASQAFAITPSPGHGIVSMTVDSSPIVPVSSYAFPNVTANHTISATFARLVSMNNRNALIDSKVPGRTIKVWGKVLSVNGTTSFTISDGYGSSITVMVNGVTLPPAFGTNKTAVVTGLLSADKKIQAQEVEAL